MAVRKWIPSPNDATSLAAFRWLANTLENEAMALYVTHPDKFGEIEHVLRHALHEMHRLKSANYVAMEENGCPDGWVLCDGVCLPSCDSIEEVQAESSKS
jgi:hypothetical protein